MNENMIKVLCGERLKNKLDKMGIHYERYSTFRCDSYSHLGFFVLPCSTHILLEPLFSGEEFVFD